MLCDLFAQVLAGAIAAYEAALWLRATSGESAGPLPRLILAQNANRYDALSSLRATARSARGSAGTFGDGRTGESTGGGCISWLPAG